jgi:hypothetical protein
MGGVIIALAKYGNTHEREDGHDTMKNQVRRGSGQTGDQEKGSILDDGARRLLDAVNKQVSVATRAVNLELLVRFVDWHHGKKASENKVLQIAQFRSDNCSKVLELRKGSEQTIQEIRVLSRVGVLDQLQNECDLSQLLAKLGGDLSDEATVASRRASSTSLVGWRLGNHLCSSWDGLEEIVKNVGSESHVPQEVSSLGRND